jgi:hypothetical protein
MRSPNPLSSKHVIIDSELHDDVRQTVFPTLAEGVILTAPKFSPVIVTLKPPDAAALW